MNGWSINFYPFLSGNTRLWLAVSLLLGSLITVDRQAAAYSPDDPAVLARVDRGLRYLEKSSLNGIVGGEYDGGQILVGYAVYKVTADKDHPLVQRGLKVAIERAQTAATNPNRYHKIVYDASVAAHVSGGSGPGRVSTSVDADPRLLAIRSKAAWRLWLSGESSWRYFADAIRDAGDVGHVEE